MGSKFPEDENEFAIYKMLDSNEEDINKYKPYVDKMDYTKLNMFGRAVKMSIISHIQMCHNYELLEILLKNYKSSGDILTRKNQNAFQIVSVLCDMINVAILEGDYDSVELCLRYVIDINELDEGGRSYLRNARESFHTNDDIIDILIENGAVE